MDVPANFAVYLGNVPNPQGILRNRTAKRNRRYKDSKQIPEHDQNAIIQEQQRGSSQPSQSPQQMEPRDIVLDKSITDSK